MAEQSLPISVKGVELLKSGAGRFPQTPNGRLSEIPPVTDEQIRQYAASLARAYEQLSNGQKPMRIDDFVELL